MKFGQSNCNMTRNQLIDKLKNNFNIKELVCPHCYNKFKENAWQFLSTELLSVLHTLRYIIFNKPIIINNWHNNGQCSQRGLRCNICQLVKDKKSIYISPHSLGKAIDFNVKDVDIEECKNIIRQNKYKFEYPIRLESNTDTWIHVDVYQPVDSEVKLIEFDG